MSATPFSNSLLAALVGDEELASYFTDGAEIDAMLRFETALASVEEEAGVLPSGTGSAIRELVADFTPDMQALKEGMSRDGVVVPELVRQLREHVGDEVANHVHFGATSQDVIDTGLAIRLRRVLETIDERLSLLVHALEALKRRDGDIPVMAHTRMQRAVPVTASRIIGSWLQPALRHREHLERVKSDICVVSFGGAAGTLDKLGGKGTAVRDKLAEALELGVPSGIPHSERDAQAALAAWLAQVSGSLGKMGQDIALHAQNEVGSIRLSEGGGSSAMPHKINAVGAEVLVTLARFNATLVSGMTHAMVHEYERSGSAWTMEWMLLPQMVMATAGGLKTALKLIEAISFVSEGA